MSNCCVERPANSARRANPSNEARQLHCGIVDAQFISWLFAAENARCNVTARFQPGCAARRRSGRPSDVRRRPGAALDAIPAPGCASRDAFNPMGRCRVGGGTPGETARFACSTGAKEVAGLSSRESRHHHEPRLQPRRAKSRHYLRDNTGAHPIEDHGQSLVEQNVLTGHSAPCKSGLQPRWKTPARQQDARSVWSAARPTRVHLARIPTTEALAFVRS